MPLAYKAVVSPDAPPPPPPAQVIVVVGKALPSAPAERAFHVDEMSGDRLRNAPENNLQQMLVSLPGVQLFRRSGSDSAHPTSQGITLRGLGGNASSRALLILDGVPQADPFGGWVNWPAYDAFGLERVRVVRGGGNVGYGSGALAGTIELESRSDSGGAASLYAGSRHEVGGSASTGAELGGGLLTVSGQAARSDGFIPVTADTRGSADRPAPYREATLRSRFIRPLAHDVELQVGMLAFDDQRERGVAFSANKTRGADASFRLVGSGRWAWSALAYGQWRDFTSSFASLDDQRATASRVALQHVPSRGNGLSAEIRPPVPGVELRLGGDHRSTTGESRELYTYVDGDATRRRWAGGRSRTAGAFAEAKTEVGTVTLSAGARLDRWTVGAGHLREQLIANGTPFRNDAFLDRGGWQPIGRLTAVWTANPHLFVRAAAYRAWRLPTLNELFRPFRAGADATAANPELDPERLRGVELGLDYQASRWEFSLTGFANRLADGIANVTLGHGPGQFAGVGFVAGTYRQRRNLDAVRSRGLEASAGYHAGPWSLRFATSFTHARVEARGPAADLDGRRPAQTPAVTALSEFGWSDHRRELRVAIRRVGPQFDDDLNYRRLGAATTLDAFAAWPLTKSLQIFGRAENLTNALVPAAIDDDGAVERTTPRTLRLGIRFGS